MRYLLLILPFLFLNACGARRDTVTRIPGFPAVPESSLSTVRESDYTYIRSVDGHRVGSSGMYGTFQLPAGHHTFILYYRGGGMHSIDNAALTVDLLPGHSYVFHAKADDSTLRGHVNLVDEPTTRPAVFP